MACDHCGAPYTPDDIAVVLQDEMQCLLNASCAVCETDRTVTAYDEPPYHHLKRLARIVPRKFTTQDCAEWRAFLSAFGGDLIDLLGEA